MLYVDFFFSFFLREMLYVVENDKIEKREKKNSKIFFSTLLEEKIQV